MSATSRMILGRFVCARHVLAATYQHQLANDYQIANDRELANLESQIIRQDAPATLLLVRKGATDYGDSGE